MEWYVVRYIVNSYLDLQQMFAQASSIAKAIQQIEKKLYVNGINAVVVGAYLDDTQTPFGPSPFNEVKTQPKRKRRHQLE